MLLDHPAQGTGAHFGIVALFTEPIGSRFGDLDGHIAIHQLRFELQHKFFDHLRNDIAVQWGKADHRIEAIAELGRKGAFNGLGVFALTAFAAKSDGGFRHFRRSGIGRHDQHHIAKICGAAIVICQFAMIHDL